LEVCADGDARNAVPDRPERSVVSATSSIGLVSAAYDSVADAEVDYDAAKNVFEAAGVPSSFDAAVIDLSTKGKPRFARTQAPSSHTTAGTGASSWAARVARHLFEGLAIVGGEAGGADVDDPSGAGSSTGLEVDELERLEASLTHATAGLLVAYPIELADRIRESLHPRERYAANLVNADLQKLDAQISDAVHGSDSPRDETT
jgi:hypothetical protein